MPHTDIPIGRQVDRLPRDRGMASARAIVPGSVGEPSFREAGLDRTAFVDEIAARAGLAGRLQAVRNDRPGRSPAAAILRYTDAPR